MTLRLTDAEEQDLNDYIETLPAGVSRSEGARRALFTTVRREMLALKKKAKGGKT